MDYSLNKTIFHAFNMRYDNIAAVAKSISEAGCTHVQFPVVQEGRGFRNFYELLEDNLKDEKLYDTKYIEYIILSKEKDKVYPGNQFVEFFKLKKNYLNQPIISQIHSYYDSDDFYNKIRGAAFGIFLDDTVINILGELRESLLKKEITDEEINKTIKNVNGTILRIREMISSLMGDNNKEDNEGVINLREKIELFITVKGDLKGDSKEKFNYLLSLTEVTRKTLKNRLIKYIKSGAITHISEYIKKKYFSDTIQTILEDKENSIVAKYILIYYSYTTMSRELTKEEKIVKNTLQPLIDFADAIMKYLNKQTSKDSVDPIGYYLNRAKIEPIRKLMEREPFIPRDVISSKLPESLKYPSVFLKYLYILEFVIYPPWWWTYQPVKFEIGDTPLGNRAELIAAIKECKKNNLKIIIDVVLNNLASVAGEQQTWQAYIDNAENKDVKRARKFDDLLELTKILTGNSDINRLPTLQDYNNFLPEAKRNEQCIQDMKLLLKGAFGCHKDYKKLEDTNRVLDLLTIPLPPVSTIDKRKYYLETTRSWMSQALPQVNQDHTIVCDIIEEFLKDLVNIGVDGIRLDAAAHIPPERVKTILTTFDKFYSEKNKETISDCSYIEYLSSSGNKYGVDSYRNIGARLEDFGIGADLYKNIFVEHGDVYRLKNYGAQKLNREPRLDSVVMLVNHDHMMGSIESELYGLYPSQFTYVMALSFLLQRIYGMVLLMPHDFSYPFVRHALILRKKMYDAKITNEHTSAYKDETTEFGSKHVNFISNKKIDDTTIFSTFFNLSAYEQFYKPTISSKTLTFTIRPKTFSWVEFFDTYRIKGARVNTSNTKNTNLVNKYKPYTKYKNGLEITYKNQKEIPILYKYNKNLSTSLDAEVLNSKIRDYFYKRNSTNLVPIEELNSIYNVERYEPLARINTTLFNGGKRKTRKQKRQKRRYTRKPKNSRKN